MKIPFETNLNEKLIVITGGGGVICRTLAESLWKTGATLALLDINLEAANEIACNINNKGGKAKAYKANVLDREMMEAVRNEIKSDFGICDILINGAGGNNPKATTDNEFCEQKKTVQKDFFDLETEGIKFVFDLNILGTIIPTQVFAKDMVGKDDCSIINISSMNAFTPLTKIPAYSAAKSGVSNFTKWLAVHFAKVGIRVNAIAPGFFVTGQNNELLFNKDGSPTPRTGKILNATPMGRFGELEELIGATLFLLNKQASGFITGVVLPIDGGFSAYSGV